MIPLTVVAALALSWWLLRRREQARLHRMLGVHPTIQRVRLHLTPEPLDLGPLWAEEERRKRSRRVQLDLRSRATTGAEAEAPPRAGDEVPCPAYNQPGVGRA